MFYGIFFLEALNIETGYIYNRIDKHGFYISLGFDLIGAISALAQGYIMGDYKKNPGKYPYPPPFEKY